MWIVANGALKSGSTWMFQLLTSSGNFKSIPKELQNPDWKNASVANDKVQGSIEQLGGGEEWYISKQHWANRNDFLASAPGVKVLNITRDVRDTVVSRFHHDVKVFGYKGDISQYLEEKSAELVRSHVEYQRYWLDSPSISLGGYHILTYEYLTFAYDMAVQDLFDFVGLSLSDDQFSSVLEQNRFENKANTGPGNFFRKGQAFSYGEDLTTSQANTLLDMAKEAGWLEVKESMAKFNPTLRPYLEEIDCGL